MHALYHSCSIEWRGGSAGDMRTVVSGQARPIDWQVHHITPYCTALHCQTPQQNTVRLSTIRIHQPAQQTIQTANQLTVRSTGLNIANARWFVVGHLPAADSHSLAFHNPRQGKGAEGKPRMNWLTSGSLALAGRGHLSVQRHETCSFACPELSPSNCYPSTVLLTFAFLPWFDLV